PWTFRSVSANVRKPLHYGFFGSWKFPPTSAKMRHFPCHRQYIGSTNRDYSPAPARRRGSGAARGYWGLLGTTMKGQVSGSGHLDGSIVCPPGTKAYGGSDFVSGLALFPFRQRFLNGLLTTRARARGELWVGWSKN